MRGPRGLDGAGGGGAAAAGAFPGRPFFTGPGGDQLAGLQSDLFAVGAELATPPSQEAKLAAHMQLALDERTAALEAEIDRLEAALHPLKSFILPAGTPAAAALHVARAVCRRAERRTVALAKVDTVRRPRASLRIAASDSGPVADFSDHSSSWRAAARRARK